LLASRSPGPGASAPSTGEGRSSTAAVAAGLEMGLGSMEEGEAGIAATMAARTSIQAAEAMPTPTQAAGGPMSKPIRVAAADTLAGTTTTISKEAPMSDQDAVHKEKWRPSASLVGIIAAAAVLAFVIIVLAVKVGRLNTQVADDQKALADAKSNSAQVQSQLDQANAASADLKAQLEKANTQLSDSKSQLDLARDSSARLQVQMDRAKVQQADLQSQLDKSKAQSADILAQLNQANAGSARMLTQLDQDKIQAMDLQSRLQKAESDIAELQPLLLKAGHMPVTASFEKLDGGRNFTLHINNLYPQPIRVDVAVAGADVKRSQSTIIGGSGTIDVKRLTAGESVVIASNGYAQMNLTVQ
jgi:hypothetical protein